MLETSQQFKVKICKHTRRNILIFKSCTMADIIQMGQFVVVQRQDFTKLVKFTDKSSTVTMGQDIIQLENINNHKWFKTFKMQLEEGGKRKRVFSLEPCDNASDMKEILKTIDSGVDNRNIKDDGQVSRQLFTPTSQSSRP